MALPTASPRARMSMSLSERNLNVTLPVTNTEFKAKKRAVMSMGGATTIRDDLSPRRKARRSMQPRKSILKFNSGNNLANTDDTVDFTAQYANTIAFGMPRNEDDTRTFARRVSFAPNAHVRMFEAHQLSHSQSSSVAPSESHQPQSIGSSTSSVGPRASFAAAPGASIAAAARRSSLPSTSPYFPSGVEGGDESMDLETESEASQSSDELEGVQMGRPQSAAGHYDDPQSPVDEDDEEDEMDMDVTQIQYGGILRRESMAAALAENQPEDMSGVTDEADMSIASRGTDEEKTMDFTIAVGGLIPLAPPVGAERGRASIGYSMPHGQGERLLPGQGSDAVEGEMEMEETIAIGGIIHGDESLSSGHSGDDTQNGVGRERTMTFSFSHAQTASVNVNVVEVQDDTREMEMEMTMAHGGVNAYPPTSPARHTALTRPQAGTPSFSRPTASSAQKTKTIEKRNVFAPSPSPYKSTTPKKSGMATAGEVAKRLSFGSAPSSAMKRRDPPSADHIGPSPSKKARQSLPTEGVFSDRASTSSRVTNIFAEPQAMPSGTPSRSASSSSSRQRMSMAKSPARSPAIRRAMGISVPDEEFEQEASAEDAEGAWEEPPTISLASFLEMAGVQFMEGLPGLNRRRSSVGRGILGQSISGDREFKAHEYVEAHIHDIMLNMYSWGADKMRADIQEGQADLLAQEEITSLHNPIVIREYLAATDDEKQIFEMTFKNFKTNTHLKARERWYDWKTSLVEKMRPDVEESLAAMREDDERLTEMTEQADSLLPELRERFAALQAEVVKEREVIAEVVKCDPEELAEYRAAIAEQSTQISGFTSELSDGAAKLTGLNGKLEELRSKKGELASAIALARSRCDHFSKSDVARLQEEYTALQDLHLWHIESVNSGSITLSFDKEVRLMIPMAGVKPSLSTVQLDILERDASKSGALRASDPTRHLFSLFQQAVSRLASDKTCSTLPHYVQRVGHLWTAAQRLRGEMRLLALRYPVTFEESTSSAKATLAVVFQSIKSKVDLSFDLTPELLARWPAALADVPVSAKTVYGPADADMLAKMAAETMATAQPEGYLGAFLQAAVDVQSQY